MTFHEIAKETQRAQAMAILCLAISIPFYSTFTHM